ncbi:MAG TPA: hypothetical protein PK605_03770 [Ignavibacteria bacterium]|nr:hypothetical protein [Ignavibacteria bacterium]HRF66121.1 hypothetical protein [Ignavibacteria bacterium]HRJ03503.1 hypothetical protein [Ignavibacteria bacterium]HRJ84087.1 hypothetical protein [Ignavibacteria bacterium]
MTIHRANACGYSKIGYMEKTGSMNGVWRQTILFERRSKIVGV